MSEKSFCHRFEIQFEITFHKVRAKMGKILNLSLVCQRCVRKFNFASLAKNMENLSSLTYQYLWKKMRDLQWPWMIMLALPRYRLLIFQVLWHLTSESFESFSNVTANSESKLQGKTYLPVKKKRDWEVQFGSLVYTYRVPGKPSHFSSHEFFWLAEVRGGSIFRERPFSAF